MARYATSAGVEVDMLRPFTCSGNPLECNVVTIGFNPANPISGLFNACWCRLYGEFDRSKFEQMYQQAKGGKPLRKNTTRYKLSEMKRQLLELNKEAKILETNLWPFPTKRKKDLKERHKVEGMNCLKLLLKENRTTKLIVTLGRDAGESFHEWRWELPETVQILNCPHPAHVAGQWNSQRIAEKINECLK